MHYNCALEKIIEYLSMNKNMQNSYLMGCMISTKTGYDYRIGSILLYRRAFKRIHSIGNIRLSRIQTGIEKDHTFYSKEYYARAIGPIIKISISWMHDLFCKHGESL